MLEVCLDRPLLSRPAQAAVAWLGANDFQGAQAWSNGSTSVAERWDLRKSCSVSTDIRDEA
jgi:hypothetical protein